MHKGKKILNYRNITKKGGAQKDKKERNKRRQTAKNLKAIYRKNAKTAKREQNKNYKMYQNIEQTFPQGTPVVNEAVVNGNQPVAPAANGAQAVNGNQPDAPVVNGNQPVAPAANEAVVNGNQPVVNGAQAVNGVQPAVPANKRNRSENATQKAINRRAKTISENDEANRSANLTSLFNKSNQPVVNSEVPQNGNKPITQVPEAVVDVYRSTLTTEQQKDYNMLSNENKKKYKNLNEEQQLEFNIINSKYKTQYLNANKNGRNKIILEHPGNDANEAQFVNRPVNEAVNEAENDAQVENDANGANNFEMLTNAEVKEAKNAVLSNKSVNSKSYTFKCNQFNKNATHRKFKCKRVTSKGVMNSFFGKKGSTMFGKGGKHSTRKRYKQRKSRNTGSKN